MRTTRLTIVQAHHAGLRSGISRGALTAGVLFTLMFSSLAVAQSVTRGPYLQMARPDGMIVRWRTDSNTDSVVRYGSAPGSLTQTVTVAGSRTEHAIDVTGLTHSTRYYYSVGNSGGTIVGGDANHFFHTAPPVGANAPVRVWIQGDAGTNSTNQRNVRDAFVNWTGSTYVNVIMPLGDNAYNSGTDTEYQNGYFGTTNAYGNQLRTWASYPTMGNHDAPNASTVYYPSFSLPAGGECGGTPSGTEQYYSFDYGNVHFICLNSQEVSRSATGPMALWLTQDLANTNQEWIVAYFHHPVYSKGSHNSDTEGALIDMRQNILPILEAGGVDMTFQGHSHCYERSFFVDGHYGNSGSFNPGTHVVQPGDGRVSGNGAYTKAAGGGGNLGAVHTTAGSSGQTSGGSLDHPVHYYAANSLGSMALDFSGNRVDAYYIRNTGAVDDNFTIIKGTPQPTPTPGASPTPAPSSTPAPTPTPPPPGLFIDLNSVWKYLDNGSDQGTAWRNQGFNDATWASGAAELGYGDGDETTVVSFGPDSGNKYRTTYFRKIFNLPDASIYSGLDVDFVRDDGIVVYINGTEVVRDNLPGGTITYTTNASGALGGAAESAINTAPANPALLVNGINTVAVEIHQANGSSSDISFNLRLRGTASAPTPSPAPSATPTAVPCCQGDANNSGSFVDAADFIAVQANFGADNGVGGLGDANCSGSFVDAADFIAVQANFGADCG